MSDRPGAVLAALIGVTIIGLIFWQRGIVGRNRDARFVAAYEEREGFRLADPEYRERLGAQRRDVRLSQIRRGPQLGEVTAVRLRSTSDGRPVVELEAATGTVTLWGTRPEGDPVPDVRFRLSDISVEMAERTDHLLPVANR